MSPEEICGLIKQKFFDIRKGYFHQKSYQDISKGAVAVLHAHESLFDILQPMSQEDLDWILNTAPGVLVKQLSYLNPPNFLMVDLIELREQLKKLIETTGEININRIADSTQWTFDSIAKTINTKFEREQKKPTDQDKRRKKK